MFNLKNQLFINGNYQMNSHIVKMLGWLPLEFVSEVCNLIEKCDKAHTFEHVFSVVEVAAKLSENDNDAILAALCHDIGCSIHRDNHNVLSCTLARPLLLKYNIDCKIDIVLSAILEHRASWQNGYSSKISEYVAAADRGIPLADEYLKRSYIYARSKCGKNHYDSVIHANEHVLHRFQSDDLKLPDWYKTMFQKEWDQMLEEFRNETVEITAKRMKHYQNQVF